VAALLLGLIAVGAGLGLATRLGQGMDHAAMIEARGAQVMPFDQKKTTHIFRKTDGGGVQSVVVKDPADQRQIELIRSHLREEAEKFRQGNYEDPARIHGMDMPGLKELEAGYTRVAVGYADLPDGGRITYTTAEPALVSALHAWFDRQVMDHGAHAKAG
jgi:hypothetical protein